MLCLSGFELYSRWVPLTLVNFEKLFYFNLLQVCTSMSLCIWQCDLYLLLAFWAVIFMFHSIWIFTNFAAPQLPLGITAPCRVEKQSTLYSTGERERELYFLEGHNFCYHVVMAEGFVGEEVNKPYSKLCLNKEYFFNPVILTLNFVQSRNPDGYFWHSTSCT